MPKKISQLQYITQPVPGKTTTDLVEEVCKAGIKWVQLRIKYLSREEFFKEAVSVKKVCDKYGVALIINDFVDIAKKIGAAGVHLGKHDMPIKEARLILGDEYIIGATINHIDDLQNDDLKYADYIGAGPFRFTETKKNLSPVLGLTIIKEIANNSTIPVIAIGGITANDSENIKSEGIYGVAVSSDITFAENKQFTVEQFYKYFAQENESYVSNC